MLFSVFVVWWPPNPHLVEAELTAPPADIVDLSYLAANLELFKGLSVVTRGVARFFASVYMFEDFWIQAVGQDSVRIPVVTRLAGLPLPRDGDLIEIAGTVEFSSLEGGFFFQIGRAHV